MGSSDQPAVESIDLRKWVSIDGALTGLNDVVNSAAAGQDQNALLAQRRQQLSRFEVMGRIRQSDAPNRKPSPPAVGREI